MEYTVQKGDTIAAVTSMFGTDWQTIRQNNSSAVGRSSRNGNWFLKEGKTIDVGKTFNSVLEEQLAKKHETTKPVVVARDETATSANEIIHTVQPGDTIWEMAVKKYHVDPNDIMELNAISDPRRLMPGQQLRIPVPEKPEPEMVVASWYGEYHHGRPMANGESFDMYGNTIAHKEIPLGTRVELENPQTGEKVQAVVADRGPYVEGRDVDLSYRLAERLSLVQAGIGSLVLRIL